MLALTPSWPKSSTVAWWSTTAPQLTMHPTPRRASVPSIAPAMMAEYALTHCESIVQKTYHFKLA